MLKDFVSGARPIHAEYLRRRIPAPPERTGHRMRRVLGETLIIIGERLVGVERQRHLEKAA